MARARCFDGGGPSRGRWVARWPSETLSLNPEKQTRAAFGPAFFCLTAKIRLSGLALGAERAASSVRATYGRETGHQPLEPSAGIRFAPCTAIIGSRWKGANIKSTSAGAANSCSRDAV